MFLNPGLVRVAALPSTNTTCQAGLVPCEATRQVLFSKDGAGRATKAEHVWTVPGCHFPSE